MNFEYLTKKNVMRFNCKLFDHLRAGKPSQYVTGHLGQLSLTSLPE